MKKILLSLLAFAGVSALGAAVLNIGAPELLPQAKEMLPQSSQSASGPVAAASMKLEAVPDFAPASAAAHADVLRSEVTWSEWEELCTTSFPQNVLDYLAALCNTYDATMPEFTQPFQVMKRTASDGTSQLCFKNVFNSVDVLIDVLADGSFTCNVPTGIVIPGAPEDWYGDFHLYMKGWYLEGARQLQVSSLFWLVYGNSGYSYGPTEIVLGEAPEFTFSLAKQSVFVPSDQTEATFEVLRSPEVSFYRIVSSYDVTLFMSDLYAMMQYEPDNKYDGMWRDVSDNTFTVEARNDMDYFYLIPFDENNVAIGNRVTARTCYNKPLEGTWRSLGQGKLRDFAVYCMLNSNAEGMYENESEGLETPVEVEVLEGNEGMIRFKSPYNASHPLASYLTMCDTNGQQDDFYFVIDTTDPSRVVMKERMNGLAGFEWNGYAWNYSDHLRYIEEGWSVEELDRVYGHNWGKYADRRIMFPAQSISFPYTHATVGYNTVCPYILELPGYVDYDVEVTSFSLDADGNAVGVISGIPSSVTSIAYALVPSDDFKENSNFMERYVERFADGMDDRFQIRTVQTEGASEVTVTVSSFWVYNGHYRLVAVSQDAQGVCHHAVASANEITKMPPVTEWTDYGKAKVIDSSVMAAFNGVPVAEMVVDVKVCPGMPGLLYIPDYYRQWAEAVGHPQWYNAEDAEPYFINATDPNFVFVTPNADGSRANRPMKTGLNVNPDYATVCLMNYSDYNTGSEGAGRASYTSLPSGELDRILSVYFNDGPLMCAVYDTAGNWLAGNFGQTQFIFGYDPSTDMSLVENWYDLGWVDVTENIALSRSSDETSEFKASIRQAPFDEDLYALVDLYRKMNHPTIKQLDYTPSQPLFVKFGPDNTVWLSTSYDGDLASGEAIWETGLLYSGVPISVCLMANAVRMEMINGEGFIEQDYYGTYQDGELILDNCLWSYDNGYIQPATNATFRIRLPRSGVESAVVAADEDAPVEYYNLQGVRVAHPFGGIFIRRQGAQVTKVYVK